MSVVSPQPAGNLPVLTRKPLMRGWSHAMAAVGAVVLTVAMIWSSWRNMPRLIAVLIYGLSTVQLYVVSATYHIGRWGRTGARVLRGLDHANIFVQIAGTYTPLCVIGLSGAFRAGVLGAIWGLAGLGIGFSVFAERVPHWAHAMVYLGMGWASVVLLPTLVRTMHWPPVLLLMGGGLLYSTGAIVYARRRPNPFPRVFGFHEIFHLFVIAAGVLMAVVIWFWVLPHHV